MSCALWKTPLQQPCRGTAQSTCCSGCARPALVPAYSASALPETSCGRAPAPSRIAKARAASASSPPASLSQPAAELWSEPHWQWPELCSMQGLARKRHPAGVLCQPTDNGGRSHLKSVKRLALCAPVHHERRQWPALGRLWLCAPPPPPQGHTHVCTSGLQVPCCACPCAS